MNDDGSPEFRHYAHACKVWIKKPSLETRAEVVRTYRLWIDKFAPGDVDMLMAVLKSGLDRGGPAPQP